MSPERKRHHILCQDIDGTVMSHTDIERFTLPAENTLTTEWHLNYWNYGEDNKLKYLSYKTKGLAMHDYQRFVTLFVIEI